MCKRPGKLRALEKRSRGSEKDANILPRETLERLHPLTGDFGVRLGFTETFAGRVKRNRNFRADRLQVCQPPLGRGHALRYQDEESTGGAPGKRGNQNGVA
jgi:hypothetical protein